MSVRKSLLILALVMVVFPLGVFRYTSQRAAENAAQAETPTYETHIVQRGRIEQVVSAIGTIEADQTVSLSFLTPGRVQDIYVKSGDYMFAGEELIRLDDTNQRIAYNQAQLALDKAQLALEDILTPVSADDLAIAKANVDSAWGQYVSISSAVTPDDIRAAELAYQQQLNTYNDLIAARDQAPGGYGSPTYNTLDAQAGAASFNAEIARLQLEILKTGSQPSAYAAYARAILAEKQYDQLAAGPRQVQIDSAALNVAAAESRLNRAETSLQRTVLTAPFDGVISAVRAEIGALVAPGLTVIEMADLSPLRLTVQVDEVDIRLIQAGLNASVKFDALRDVTIPAQVERVSLLGTNVNGIVNYDVFLTLDNVDARVRVGMTAEANIVIAERDNVLVVPNIYIRLDRRTGQAFVNIINAKGQLEEIEVTLGLQGEETSEILAGLSEGAIIAIDPNDNVFSFF